MTRDFRNGTAAGQLTGVDWRTSSYSGKEGNCVQVGELPGVLAVRDSQDPHGPALIWTRNELSRFLAAVKDGGFDGRHH